MEITKIKKSEADAKDYLKACEDVGSAMLKLLEAEEKLKHIDDRIVKMIGAHSDLLHDLMGRLKDSYWELKDVSK